MEVSCKKTEEPAYEFHELVLSRTAEGKFIREGYYKVSHGEMASEARAGSPRYYKRSKARKSWKNWSKSWYILLGCEIERNWKGWRSQSQALIIL
jgi:hypothetical protein